MVFYRSFYEAVKGLPAEDFKRCALAILEYGLDGVEPVTDGIEYTVFVMARPQIDKNNQRYMNGKSGGRNANTNQTETKQKPKRNQTKTKAEPNVNVNDNVNVNVNVLKDNSSELNSEPPPEDEKAVITLPLNDNSQYPIFAGAVQEWAELYPAVDVIQQLRSMKGWLNSHPNNRKTKRGIDKFINGWLSREQDKGGVKSEKQTAKKGLKNYEERDWDFDELERIKREELIRNSWE